MERIDGGWGDEFADLQMNEETEESQSTGAGYDEESLAVQTVGFDYNAVEEALAEIDFAAEIADMKAEELERAFKVIQALMGWIHNGSLDCRGIAIRSIIVAWLTLPHLRSLSLTQIAARHGMDKQSVGRWVEDKERGFKVKFPSVKTSNMNFK
jgi:hypothetical protein